MRYMLLIYADETRYEKLSQAEGQKLLNAYMKFTDDVQKAKAFVSSDRLRPTPTATTVRVRDGKVVTTDGPFAETKEQLGGYYMIEAKNLDEAIKWAGQVPSAKYGTVEVRPVWEYPEP